MHHQLNSTNPHSKPTSATAKYINSNTKRPVPTPTLFNPKKATPLPPRPRPFDKVNNTNVNNTRTPLRLRDRNLQNAPSLSSTTTTRPSTTIARRMSNMPINNNRQPQLAATSKRAAPPLTPKVVSKVAQPLITPVLRRTQTGNTDVATPTSAPFLANITPRSGSRQTRVESTNTTPNGTPTLEKQQDSWETSSRVSLGVPALALGANKGQGQQEESTESKFFYASDAKPSQGPPSRPSSVISQKPTTFFYASNTPESIKPASNGRRTISPTSNQAFTPILATTPEPTTTQFFHANGVPDNNPRPSVTNSASGSVVSMSSRMAPSRPSSGASAPVMTARPLSPTKFAMIPSAIQPLKASALAPGPPIRPTLSSPPALAPPSSMNAKRRVSIESAPRAPPRKGHARTGSVPVVDPMFLPRYMQSPQPSEPGSPPLSPGLSQPAMTMASILQAAEELVQEDESKDDSSQYELRSPPSPTKSTHSLDPISELVANARRERKVQDLEITNASLEAINRTLERQLRRQTAELRRYRRLSRSGRLSITSSAVSSRQTSAAMSEVPAHLFDLSEEEDSDDDDERDSLDDSEFDSDETSTAGDPPSPSSRILSRRKRDERRLQLDLSKHQELLIDSQKINQSIKRCMDWTEMLIKEGNKALQYHVRVSDVEVGGRVLVPADEDEETASQQDDKSVIIYDVAPPPVPEALPPPKELPDRDSGVEMPVDDG